MHNKIILLKYSIYISSLMLAVALSAYKPMIRGDVSLYNTWSQNFLMGEMLGLESSWVYPYIAIAPMLIASSLSMVVPSYSLSWLLIISFLNVIAFSLFEKTYREKIKLIHVILYSLVNIFLFGIFLFRLDGVAIPATLIAIAIFKKHKYISYLILFIFMLIKIWPVAFIVGFWLASRAKIKDALTLGGYFIVCMVLPNLFFGHVFDFLYTQNNRGIQIESFFALPFVLVNNAFYFDEKIITYQVQNSLVPHEYMIIATYLMFAIIIAIGITYWFLNRNNFVFENGIILGAFMTIVFICFNKIGSPQFLGWMQIVIMCFAIAIPWNRIHIALLAIVAGTCLFTGILTPVFYKELIHQDTIGIIFLSLKSLFLFLLFIFFTFYMVKSKPIIK